jgi:hypothetical protein
LSSRRSKLVKIVIGSAVGFAALQVFPASKFGVHEVSTDGTKAWQFATVSDRVRDPALCGALDYVELADGQNRASDAGARATDARSST